MNQSICNICGANYEYRNGRWKCPACGAFKAEELSNEEATLLYNAAQKLRVQEFDVAEELYSDIISKYPKQHEAYWGYVCAKYGIKYEVDFDGRKIPTCCYTTIESFTDDIDYKKAIKYAPTDVAAWYKTQADYIERVRTTWIEKAKNEAPYDIFISYKDSDVEHGIERTEDSYNALELYNHLARQGYNVFYSKESLRDKVGEKYEPYIYHALQTSKVMIVYCSSVEYVNSTWVKNEWHRYIKQISRGEKKEGSLLVVCDGFSPNELPTILSSKQCLDGKSKNLYIDIDDYLKRLYSPKTAEEKTPIPKKKVVVNPLHEHTYTDEVVPASCVARGYTVHRCACGYEHKDTYTGLAEHKYAHKTTKEPTCTTAGYTEEVCTVCGDKKVNNIPAKGHTFGKWIEKISPTCTVAGKKIRQCSECGHIEEDTLPPKGHQWSPMEQRIDERGNKEYVSFCRLCGEEKISKETDEERKAREIKEQLGKKSLKSAIASGVTAICFLLFMIINFSGGEKIGWGIFFLIIAFVCGGASISFAKEFIKSKPPLSEEARIRRKKKLTLILIATVGLAILTIIIAIIAVRNNPKSQFEYTQHWRNDHVTIQGIKNDNYAINNGTVEIPSTIDGKPVGLGSLVFEGKNITTLILPKNLKEIFSDSLDGCIGLKNIEFKGTISDWNRIDGSDDIDISKYTFTHEGDCECNDWSINASYDCELGGTKTRNCLYCNKVYTETISPKSHDSQILSKVEPTCASIGKTEGAKCLVCDKMLVEQEDIPKLSHTVVVDNAVPATCSATGLTEGSHCSSCKAVLVAQKTVSKTSHTMSGWTTTVSAGCMTTGTQVKSCSKCTYKETQMLPATGHSFGTTTCTNCGMEKPSQGLLYNLVSDGYEVADVGDCTDSRIVLPDYYNGKPVVSIGNSAFANIQTISEIVMQDGLLRIGDSAFSYSSITTAKIPNSVTFIGEDAFDNCDSLVSVYLGSGLTSTGGTIFSWCDSLKGIYCPSVEIWCRASLRIFYCYQAKVYFNNVLAEEITIPGTIEKIGYEVFADISTLTTVRISEGVKEISFCAFYDSTKTTTYYKTFKTVYLPSTITYIGHDAFPYSVETVYYNGTMEEWKSVNNNEYFTKVICTDGVIKQS